MNAGRVRQARAVSLLASVLLATLSLVAAPARSEAAGEALLPVTLGPGSVLWLEGTSTVHDFECRSTEVDLTLRGEAAGLHASDAAGLAGFIRASGVRGAALRVPVASLRSAKAALDKNLRRAMRAEEHPHVRFELDRYTLSGGTAPGDTIPIRAEGRLTVAGRERTITLDARAVGAADGVWLEGSHALLMSDYGIKPPTMMLGTLRVGDRITVRYRLLLVPRAQDSGPSSPPDSSERKSP
jgi:hypothetical protein